MTKQEINDEIYNWKENEKSFRRNLDIDCSGFGKKRDMRTNACKTCLRFYPEISSACEYLTHIYKIAVKKALDVILLDTNTQIESTNVSNTKTTTEMNDLECLLRTKYGEDIVRYSCLGLIYDEKDALCQNCKMQLDCEMLTENYKAMKPVETAIDMPAKIAGISSDNKGNHNEGNNNFGRCNDGRQNIGYKNKGEQNYGMYNDGDANHGLGNLGNSNDGYWNKGNFNKGRFNNGGHNYGEMNVGLRNTGYCNRGNYNVGSWNKGNGNVGFLCTHTNHIRIFNKPFYGNFEDICWPMFFNRVEFLTRDIGVNGAIYEEVDYKNAWREAWSESGEEDKLKVLKLPNFDNNVFKEITGIDVHKELGVEEKDFNGKEIVITR